MTARAALLAAWALASPAAAQPGWEDMGAPRSGLGGAAAPLPRPAPVPQAAPPPAAPAPGGGWQGMAGRTDAQGGPAAPPSPAAQPGSGWQSLGRQTEGQGAGWEAMGRPGAGQAGAGWEAMGRRTDAMDPSAAMTRLGARVEGNEIIVDLSGDVLFDFDRSTIRPDAAAALEGVRAIILAQPGAGPVRIEGHTDSRGPDAYNQALSERRAASVRAWLAARGVQAGRMAATGFGESRPVAANERPDGRDDPDGRQRNRRVQVVITRG